MFTIAEIKDLMQTMQSTNLGEMQLQQGDFKIKLSAKPQATQTVVAAAPVAEAVAVATPAPAQPAVVAPEGTLLRAPIVGTFYSSPSPDKAPFVVAGQSVKQGDVLYIIESMKLMNEIKAEQDGTITEVLAQNGDAVEYDQPIMAIK